jgi:hypothetical protein
MTTAALGFLLFGRACRPFMRLRKRSGIASAFSWRREFWPQQWRIAVSWIFGYIMFQSFVPILFQYRGAIAAGRMGASLHVFNAINAVAYAWVYSKAPRMGMLGANGRLDDLRAVVRDSIRLSSFVAAGGAALVMVAFVLMLYVHYWADRFLSAGSMLFLMLAVVVLQRSNVETTAIRFQKIEPFIPASAGCAVLVCGSNVLMARYFGEFAVCFSFAVIMIVVTVPWNHRIYAREIRSLSHRNARGDTAS